MNELFTARNNLLYDNAVFYVPVQVVIQKEMPFLCHYCMVMHTNGVFFYNIQCLQFLVLWAICAIVLLYIFIHLYNIHLNVSTVIESLTCFCQETVFDVMYALFFYGGVSTLESN